MRSAVALVAVMLAACSGNNGVHQAEVLSTPFPGIVLTAQASDGKCQPEGCTFAYSIRITNPTDVDASVQKCRLIEPPRLELYVMGIGGLDVQAHATRTQVAHFILPLKKDAASDLVGQRVTCTGLDWHGHPPI